MKTDNLKNTFIETLGKVFAFPIAPRRHFFRLMIVSFVLLVVVVSFHMYFFNQILSRNIFQITTVPTSTSPVVNEKKLNEVLLRYENKNQNRLLLQTNPTVVVDPSN